MRLLKYPLELAKGETLVALCSIEGKLLVLTTAGHVIVWVQSELVDTAFDRLSVKDLRRQKVLSVGEIDFQEGRAQDFAFICGHDDTLFVSSERAVFKLKHWEAKEQVQKVFHSVPTPSSAITDVKLDPTNGILFVLCSNPNCVTMYDSKDGRKIQQIALDESVTPITCVTDPSGGIFTIFTLDRSILVYQYAKTGAYKLLNKLNQFVQVHPLHYHISMPPQGNYIPVVNSVRGTSSTSVTATVLLDRNDSYKIASTIVSPSASTCKVVAYSPAVYEKTNAKKGIKSRYNLLATSGTTAGTILVWNTRRMRPLFNAVQVSKSPINDMIWSEQGFTLFGVSDDNVLYTFAFQQNDLGESLPHDTVVQLQKENKPLPILDSTEVTTKVKEEEGVSNGTKGLPALTNGLSKATVLPAGEKTKKTMEHRDSKSQTPDTTPPKPASIPGVKVTQSTSMEFNMPSYSVPKDLKRKPKETANGEIIPKRQKHELEPMDFLDTGLILPNVSFSRIRLMTPKIRLNFKYTSPTNSDLQLDIKNGTGNEQKPTIVTLRSKVPEQEGQLFQDFIPKFITMCTSGDFFWACCSEDGTVYVYSDAGKRLLPPLILGVSISFLEASANHLLCVTCLGELYCWNIKKGAINFPVTSVFPVLNPSLRYADEVLTRAENITMCAVTNNGIPLLTLSNGDGYLFDKDMDTWLLISDSWWAYGSQYWDMNNTSTLGIDTANTAADDNNKSNKNWNSADIQNLVRNVKSDTSSIVNHIERKTNDELNRKSRLKNLQRFARAILMKEGFENMEEIVTLSHLENRILVSLKLEEGKEFSNLIIVYCIRLGELGYDDRLDDVLQWLYNEGELEEELLTGVARKETMKDILMACAKIRHVQRVTTTYATALGIVTDET
ncbi:Hir2p KNAG_0B03080 [Huiozyma naganishii CBS 8797]|uniref:Protein HIR n=1 Tax=Huiozyma naganishii (strain ATCC MYA-139 / BCRC 22969 / CBS 8797 / KCTC 17520 / NBRC 10181 / NCYC 3082 / Yp74L-3) TaxID=1071383 RepID=J7R1Q5_HUIN7|nr:hypothetical protein KNAG_0B03080 [Kazachstania naganishii CBS 8797]CCK68750.1 hypothetical protein KNAG_0B03080 [Kazachstania naganishii CBS 8797]